MNANSKHSLQVMATTLNSLNLISLESIVSGTVNLQWNQELCYVEEAMFHGVMDGERQVTLRENMSGEECGKYQQTSSPSPPLPLSQCCFEITQPSSYVIMILTNQGCIKSLKLLLSNNESAMQDFVRNSKLKRYHSVS